MYMHPTFATILAEETAAEKLRSARYGLPGTPTHVAGLQRSARRVVSRRVRIRGGPALRLYLRLVRS